MGDHVYQGLGAEGNMVVHCEKTGHTGNVVEKVDGEIVCDWCGSHLGKAIPHEHDPHDHDCEYRGNSCWACGHIDNCSDCDCACCTGACQA